eukprot:scaffold973_cov399-Prasinococcus_capsulatus_cf.AAC.12
MADHTHAFACASARGAMLAAAAPTRESASIYCFGACSCTCALVVAHDSPQMLSGYGAQKRVRYCDPDP